MPDLTQRRAHVHRNATVQGKRAMALFASTENLSAPAVTLTGQPEPLRVG